MRTLKRKFFINPPDIVAKNLLGKILVRKLNGKILSGKIVETEAYFGEKDPASRAHKGKKNYNLAMWGDPGRIFIYNVHDNWMFNIVAHLPKAVGAVLIRAIQPIDGIEIMKKNRSISDILQLCNGPGKLSRAVGITKEFNLIPVTRRSSPIVIVDNKTKLKIGRSKRIGITKDLPIKLRFFIKGNAFISR